MFNRVSKPPGFESIDLRPGSATHLPVAGTDGAVSGKTADPQALKRAFKRPFL